LRLLTFAASALLAACSEKAAPPAAVAQAPARVGHLALAVARSWSNSLTASAGKAGDGGLDLFLRAQHGASPERAVW